MDFQSATTTSEVAELVSRFAVVSSIHHGYRNWRVPSRLSIQDQIDFSIRFIASQTSKANAIPPQLFEYERSQLNRFEDQIRQFPPFAGDPVGISFGSAPEIEFSPEDQVVTVRGNPSIGFIQQQLALNGQCVPLRPAPDAGSLGPSLGDTIGAAIDFNLPHGLEGQCGSWRDWILGMTLVLADGTVAKSGSHAVKNVAGYDVHKLMIGARGTLGLVIEVILRTYPISALPRPEVEAHEPQPVEYGPDRKMCLWVQRTRSSDFAQAVSDAGAHLLEADWASSTLCAEVSPDQALSRYDGDWVLRSGCGSKNLEITDPTQIRLMKRAKEIFDPTHKLNPGEMGIL